MQYTLLRTAYFGTNLFFLFFPNDTNGIVEAEEVNVAFTLDVCIAPSQMASHILLLFCVCFQSRRPYSLTLCDAYESVSSRNWGVINVQIIVYFLLANLLAINSQHTYRYSDSDSDSVSDWGLIWTIIFLNVMATFGTDRLP